MEEAANRIAALPIEMRNDIFQGLMTITVSDSAIRNDELELAAWLATHWSLNEDQVRLACLFAHSRHPGSLEFER